jgi:two-component system response regulator MprA
VRSFALERLQRVRVLRRRERDRGDLLRFADLVLDPQTRQVYRGGRSIELTRTEFNLLELFLRNPGSVLARRLIFTRVWGFDFGAMSNSLNVYIGYLRRKTEAAGEVCPARAVIPKTGDIARILSEVFGNFSLTLR